MMILSSLRFEYIQGRAALGAGNFGTVRAARDLQLAATLAVKAVPKVTFDGGPETYFEEAARLYDAKHPHVVEVKYACEDEDNIFLAMPLYERGSLQSLLATRRLSNREIIAYAIGILTGVHHIHTRNLIHRDIKPSNVLITDSGQAAVSDFGLAKHLDREAGTAEAKVAYLRHAPPEWHDANVVTTRFDIYQVGATLYRMVYGDGLFNGAFVRAGETSHARLQAGRLFEFPQLPHLPEALRRAIRKAMAPNPDDRHATCLDMANDLAAIDSLLDWRPGSTGWSWEHGGARQTNVTVVAETPTVWAIESTKRHGTGRRRVTSHCRAGMTRTEAIRAAGRAIRELDES